MRRARDQPMLITSAPQSRDDEFDRRRKKYAIMMSLRAVAVIGAATTYHVSMILALSFVVIGLVLPWCAVLIANDRPAHKRAGQVGRVDSRVERALPPGRDERTVDDRTVDG